ncbi:MetQ/NlpA family ABC transporter substrate-binding protein [Clostridium coskatii]|uniref:D-methionine-binding lipoprotein MetQ n=1 Tax=Clostridium coskatii TaxID=1705578 RepID=A0A166UNX3_9CLOT|nr:MetQ/NlpA family ABC transporter substrate-binding protein [Clostridium coskatii]OAA95101.1 D-methionine-binding lipoprotein MetQ precursor [Clostridium coskatii]OBR97551.1 D-methionine-binding lipoprotein MetQ precursor [Clostridium coskatii]
MKKRKIALLGLLLILSISLAACGSKTQSTTSNSSTKSNKTYTVATTALFKDILVAAQPDFEKSGNKLVIKVFDDAITPNVALKEGSVDATFHQNEPYLITYNKQKGTDLIKFDKGLVTTFYGVYSTKIKSLNELKDGAKISVPNDASNEGRALKLLESKGLIKLKAGVASPTKIDIVENRRNLQIVEMDGWSIIKALPDVDCGVTSSSVAVKCNIDPKSAIAIDDSLKTRKYSIILVVNKDKSKDPLAKLLQDSIRTKNVKKALQEKYKGAMVPLF